MWIDKLERKFGRFAIPNLMRYIVFGSALVYLVSLVQPKIAESIILVPQLVIKGQVWRLITFIFYPGGGNILLTALSLFCYYWIGNALERTWGAFRFNLFYLIGILATVAASFIFQTWALPSYMNQVLFIALASLYPDMQIMLMYFIPMKAKWAGVISAGLLIYEFIVNRVSIPGFLNIRALIGAAFVGYIVFFLPVLIQRIKNRNRRMAYERAAAPRRPQAAARPKPQPKTDSDRGKIIQGVPFHRCHTCGITDVDDPNMTFRYCSQCNGNYEYCENHLHNHEHVR